MISIFRRRRGSSLVELVIAVLVLSIVIIGAMSAATVARLSADHKKRENASDAAMRVLEWAETLPISADIAQEFSDTFQNGEFWGLRFTIERDPQRYTEGDPSADITVSVFDSPDASKVILRKTREVSYGAARNAGER